MTLRWGVDSSHIQPNVVVNRHGLPTKAQGNYERATAEESLNGDKFTLYDYVATSLGRGEPEFWGRYINNVTTDVPTNRWIHSRFATRLVDTSEINFVHERSRGQCRLLLIFNNIKRQDCALTEQEGFLRGWADAFNAVFAARQLGVPASVCIYGDVEGWRFSEEWLWGWCDFMDRSEYTGLGGLYGRGRELWIDPQSPRNARMGAGWYRRYRNWHRRQMGRDFSLLADGAAYPEANLGTALKGVHEIEGPSRIPNALGLDDERYPAQLRDQRWSFNSDLYIWTNMPQGSCGWFTNDRRFLGLGPIGAHTVVWQYAQACHRGYLDLNIATEAGYSVMW